MAEEVLKEEEEQVLGHKNEEAMKASKNHDGCDGVGAAGRRNI